MNNSDTLKRFSIFPKSLSKSLEGIVKPIYKKRGFAEHRILSEWEAIVGAELGKFSIPQKLVFRQGKQDGGTLHIAVASARAIELQHMQATIIARISGYFGYNAVEKLVFVQTSSPLFRKKRELPASPSPEPSDNLLQIVEQCNDPDLQKALLSLGKFIVR